MNNFDVIEEGASQIVFMWQEIYGWKPTFDQWKQHCVGCPEYETCKQKNNQITPVPK